MLKNHIKGGLKVLGNYTAALLIYVILLYTFMAITGEKFDIWLPLYSFIMFLIMAMLMYTDLWHLAAKEKRPQYKMNPYPLKGLVLGLIGSLPLILVVVFGHFVTFKESAFNKLIANIADVVLLGPLYFIIALLGKTVVSYIAVLLLVPLLSMFGYMLGYQGIILRRKLGLKKDAVYEKKQELSPWNPARKHDDEGKKKKSKNKSKKRI